MLKLRLIIVQNDHTSQEKYLDIVFWRHYIIAMFYRIGENLITSFRAAIFLSNMMIYTKPASILSDLTDCSNHYFPLLCISCYILVKLFPPMIIFLILTIDLIIGSGEQSCLLLINSNNKGNSFKMTTKIKAETCIENASHLK